MKRLSLLSILCMVSMLALAQSAPPRDSVGGGMFGLSQGPSQEVASEGNAPAQSAASPLTDVGDDIPIPIGGAHTLYQTFVKYNNTETLKQGGYRNLDDATTVTCPKGGGPCLIEFDEYLQIGDSATGNRWAICAQLDGVFVSTPNCPFQGYTHVAGEYFFKAGSFVQFAGGVLPGTTHTVQTFVYSDGGLTAATWSLSYKVYQP